MSTNNSALKPLPRLPNLANHWTIWLISLVTHEHWTLMEVEWKILPGTHQQMELWLFCHIGKRIERQPLGQDLTTQRIQIWSHVIILWYSFVNRTEQVQIHDDITHLWHQITGFSDYFKWQKSTIFIECTNVLDPGIWRNYLHISKHFMQIFKTRIW